MTRKIKLGWKSKKPWPIGMYKTPDPADKFKYGNKCGRLPYYFDDDNPNVIILKGVEYKIERIPFNSKSSYITACEKRECNNCTKLGRPSCSTCIDTKGHPQWFPHIDKRTKKSVENVVLRWMRYKGIMYTYAFVRSSVFMTLASNLFIGGWLENIIYDIYERGWELIQRKNKGCVTL